MNDVPSTLNDTQSMQMKNNYIHPHSKIKKNNALYDDSIKI